MNIPRRLGAVNPGLFVHRELILPEVCQSDVDLHSRVKGFNLLNFSHLIMF